jgi:phosphatidylethanolamine/phosphatidyl-N-methylethanolamine N-methyltransferase
MSKKAFIKAYLKNPSRTGSVLPSSERVGKAFAEQLGRLSAAKIVELGPGTGAITQHIMDINPQLVEIDRELCGLLQKRFPECNIENRCAIDFLQNCHEACGLIVSIPLINNPERKNIIAALRQAYERGIISWCMIFTYGPANPLKEVGFRKSNKIKSVLLNIPPAHIWLYE